jgi:dTDP-4-dehydrorhamnose reductase
VVFGALGQLGVELVRVLTERGYEIDSSDRDTVDITSLQQVERVLASSGAEVVYNAAAYNQVDVAEQEPAAAYAVNALAVRNVAVACRQADIQLVHYSTDYVFDGRAGRPYTEEDGTHPLGAYAVSKLAGELYAQAYLEKPLVIRTSGVFGPGGLDTARGNFVESMLRLAGSGQHIRVVADHYASPAYAPALAERSVDMAERGLYGVYHVGSGMPVSWFEYAKLIFATAGLTPVLEPTNEREYRTAAHRPRFSALSNGKMERAGIAPMPPFKKAVESYFALRARRISANRA